MQVELASFLRLDMKDAHHRHCHHHFFVSYSKLG